MRMHLVAAAAVLGFVLPAGAQTMKPGLWEIHNKMSGGQMDQAMADMQKQFAQMPPEQRKQMEAAMARSGVRMTTPGAGGGMAMQVCMTKEMVERNEMPGQKGDCKTTSQQKSGNTMRMAFSCSNPPTTGESQVTFQGSDGYTSRTTIKQTVQGKTETTTMEASGKWLKADCGDVKPVVPPKK
jgi:hypothetical protein